MKAISIRQPWAQMIFDGKKTIDVRGIHTNYRGQLLIHAASITGPDEFKKANIDPKLRNQYTQKSLIGIVDLVDVFRLTQELWDELRQYHLLPGRLSEFDPKFAWVFKNPRLITPIPYIGQPALFEVNPEIVSDILNNL